MPPDLDSFPIGTQALGVWECSCETEHTAGRGSLRVPDEPFWGVETGGKSSKELMLLHFSGSSPTSDCQSDCVPGSRVVITARRRAGNAARVAPGEESREPMPEVLRRDQTPASLCPLTLAALENVLLALAGPRGQPCWQHRTGGHVLEQVAQLHARVCAHARARPVACSSCQFSVLSAYLGQVEHMYCRAVGKKEEQQEKIGALNLSTLRCP